MSFVPQPYYSCFYSRSTIINVGSFLYSDGALTTPVSDNFYSDGTYCYTVEGGNGQVTAKTVCS